MTPIQHFELIWERCNQLATLYSFMSSNLTAVLEPSEILRAEWVARVSALDLYVHEKVAQGMLSIFEGRAPATPAFSKYQLPNQVISKIRSATSQQESSKAFDLEVRGRLGFVTYQDPDKIADGVRLISQVDLWGSVALNLGASPNEKADKIKEIKKQLSLIVERRNKIAHEGDLQPAIPRTPWPITQPDVVFVSSTIRQIVHGIEAVVT